LLPGFLGKWRDSSVVEEIQKYQHYYLYTQRRCLGWHTTHLPDSHLPDSHLPVLPLWMKKERGNRKTRRGREGEKPNVETKASHPRKRLKAKRQL